MTDLIWPTRVPCKMTDQTLLRWPTKVYVLSVLTLTQPTLKCSKLAIKQCGQLGQVTQPRLALLALAGISCSLSKFYWMQWPKFTIIWHYWKFYNINWLSKRCLIHRRNESAAIIRPDLFLNLEKNVKFLWDFYETERFWLQFPLDPKLFFQLNLIQ